MTSRKWVSLDRLPCMALWCEWEAESLWISRVVGFNAAVIWYCTVNSEKGGSRGGEETDFGAHAVFYGRGRHS